MAISRQHETLPERRMPNRLPHETRTATQEDWSVVRTSGLFSRLPEETVRRIVQGQPVCAHPRTAVLCDWNAGADHCFIIIEGLVKVFRTAEDGSMAVLAIHGAGRVLMLAEALIGRGYSASAETVGPTRIMWLDAATLRRQIASDGKLAMTLLASAASHLRMLVAHIEELKTMTGPARLADMILNLAGARSGSAQVTLPYEKQLIANRLGMTPESFSRAMSQLKSHGVTVTRDRLTIKDVARLRAFASPEM